MHNKHDVNFRTDVILHQTTSITFFSAQQNPLLKIAGIILAAMPERSLGSSVEIPTRFLSSTELQLNLKHAECCCLRNSCGKGCTTLAFQDLNHTKRDREMRVVFKKECPINVPTTVYILIYRWVICSNEDSDARRRGSESLVEHLPSLTRKFNHGTENKEWTCLKKVYGMYGWV
jgi:hypothetical protein